MSELKLVNFMGPGKAYHLLVDLIIRGLHHTQVKGVMRDHGYYVPADQFQAFKKVLNTQMNLDIGGCREEASNPKMKSWFVKTEGVTAEDQFKLLKLATQTKKLQPANAVEGPIEVESEKREKFPEWIYGEQFKFFGVDAFGNTRYDDEEVCFDQDDHKNTLGLLTYQQAWDHLTTGVQPTKG